MAKGCTPWDGASSWTHTPSGILGCSVPAKCLLARPFLIAFPSLPPRVGGGVPAFFKMVGAAFRWDPPLGQEWVGGFEANG